MVQIVDGNIELNETNKNSKGGTELMAFGLHDRMDKDLLKNFQIVFSRIRGELRDDKIRIFYCHDLPGDPESNFLKDPNEQAKFHSFFFVSNWQMQAYINYYRLPWGKCFVLQNAIEPIDEHSKPKDMINLVYFSTPHRGLELLVPVFKELKKKRDNVNLYVYSSFSLYGWSERDKQYEKLFNEIRETEGAHYEGAVSNENIRENLKQMHILAYPSIWHETSCLTLMESMSAGLTCVHPNFGALYETAANFTHMYQWTDNLNDHANRFLGALDSAIEFYDSADMRDSRNSGKKYADYYYTWSKRIIEWTAILENMKHQIKDTSIPKKQEQFQLNARVSSTPL